MLQVVRSQSEYNLAAEQQQINAGADMQNLDLFVCRSQFYPYYVSSRSSPRATITILIHSSFIQGISIVYPSFLDTGRPACYTQ